MTSILIWTDQAATPIDVVKTRIQVDSSLQGQNMLKAGRSIIANEGASALLTGFGPTAVVCIRMGLSLQIQSDAISRAT